MLTRLQERGILMAILSNKPDPATKMIVEHFLGQWKFADVRGAVDHIPKKPAADASAIISKNSGIAPENFIHVGDTSVDMHTAKAAGMQSVGVTWGFRLRDELEEAGAHWIIDHPDQLP
jgi:phosphoglycolate phosphatase